MVTQKVIKRTQIGFGDVIKFEDIPSNIIVSWNEGNDSIPELWGFIVKADTADR